MSKPPQAPPAPPPRDMFGGRPIGGLGMPVQKAKNFKGTLRRLLEYLRPYQTRLAVVILAGVIGTVFTVLGPKILGMATTRIFEGFVAKACLAHSPVAAASDPSSRRASSSPANSIERSFVVRKEPVTTA